MYNWPEFREMIPDRKEFVFLRTSPRDSGRSNFLENLILGCRQIKSVHGSRFEKCTGWALFTAKILKNEFVFLRTRDFKAMYIVQTRVKFYLFRWIILVVELYLPLVDFCFSLQGAVAFEYCLLFAEQSCTGLWRVLFSQYTFDVQHLSELISHLAVESQLFPGQSHFAGEKNIKKN